MDIRWLLVVFLCGLTLIARAETPADVVADESKKPALEVSDAVRLKQDGAKRELPDAGPASLKMVGGLAVVLAIIMVLAWAAKRLQLGQSGTAGNMKILNALSVGQKEKIMLVQVENQRLLIGVTSQQVTMLQSMGVTSTANADGDFAKKMQNLLKAGSVDDK